jgi:5-hydroxyisourate hydrolase
MSGITTHVLDTARGRPGNDIDVRLERQIDGNFRPIARSKTDADGRARDLTGPTIDAGVYRLVFDVRAYFESVGAPVFFPEVAIVFVVTDAHEHFHVPLLLSPFGYSTYRGS